jgi:UDP-N-acetylmuramyl pentapeptide phosphotransferase/UDP-N-acetylglucosamine-1-phosphate transferase
MIFGAAIANLVLTNLTNFYDGADLNLATFVALTAAMMLGFDKPDATLTGLAVACLGFILPFGIINSRPKTLYLGDAGAFAFAGLLTTLLVIFLNGETLAPEAAIPLALPALDTFYVLVIRIIEKHDLLTRNYLHLYQRLEQHQRRFFYLLPQVANAVLVLTCAWGLQGAGLSRLFSVVGAAVVVTPPFYFSCRKLFLPRTKAAERT